MSQTSRLQNASANDLDHWKDRFESLVGRPQEVLRPASSAPRKWHANPVGCLWPVTTCCFATWCPCILFSKTHHRIHKNRNLDGFKILNTTCIIWCGTATLGLQWIPQLMQRAEIRQKYNIQGDWVSDLLCAFCCNCCDMIQQEKEFKFREDELLLSPEQYSNGKEQMHYSAQQPQLTQPHTQHPYIDPDVRTVSSPNPGGLHTSINYQLDGNGNPTTSMVSEKKA